MNKRKDDDDSDEEDYRKGYMKARKDKTKKSLPPPDFDNIDMLQFNKQFAKNLLQERGLEISEKEMGIENKDGKDKIKKPQALIQGGFASQEELKKQLIKVQGNISQTCTILKDIINLDNLDPKVKLYYSVVRCEMLVKNRQFEDCKVLCQQILKQKIKVTDNVRVMIALAQAQSETSELWNAQIQLLRAKSNQILLDDFDESELMNLSPYDQSLEDVLKSLDTQQLQLKVKSTKDKTTLSLLMTQGISQSGGLGLGDDISEAPDFIMLPIMRGRQIISIACGENHILALVSGCSCQNPFQQNYECKGITECNDGCEVMGWGENFLGQAVADRKMGNFVSSPMIIRGLSGKSIVGVSANRSASIGWTSDGKVFKWGAHHNVEENTITIDTNVNIKNIVGLVMGQRFIAILDISNNVYLYGKLQTSQSSQPLISHTKPIKLECKDIIQIVAGDNHLLALDDDGNVFGMGSNEFGQLGSRPSDGVFRNQMSQLQKIESACFVSAKDNLSLMITLDGELLYMGELTELKLIDYPKTAQLPPDTNLISAQYFLGQVYALSTNGQVYKWDPDNEPKFKLFQRGPIRDLQLGRGIRIFRGSLLKGGYCSINIKEDENDEETILTTFENIPIELNLKDEFGNYGIKFTHPVRLHYFITKKPTLTKKEIIDNSQLTALKQNKSKNEALVYPYKLLDSDEGCLLQFDILDREEGSNLININLQVSQAGLYHLYVLINEEFVIGAPLQLNIAKSEKEDEMLEKQKENQAMQQKILDDQIRKREEKLAIEEQRRLKQKNEIDLSEAKQRETQQRAEDALKLHQLRTLQEQSKMEEERQQKKDLLTGGGFNLDKLKAKQLLKAEEETKTVNVQITQKVSESQNIRIKSPLTNNFQPNQSSQKVNTQAMESSQKSNNFQATSQNFNNFQAADTSQKQNKTTFQIKQRQNIAPQTQQNVAPQTQQNVQQIQQTIQQYNQLTNQMKSPTSNSRNLVRRPSAQRPKGQAASVAAPQSRQVQLRTNNELLNKSNQRLPTMQLQRSAVQQPSSSNAVFIPKRSINSVQQTQRMTQTVTQFSQTQNNFQDQMSKTASKMVSPVMKVQNIMDPFQMQIRQQSPKKANNNQQVQRR